MILALRPEKVTISATREAGNSAENPNILPARITGVTYLGSMLEVEVETEAAGRLVAELSAWRNALALEPGQPVQLEWAADAAVVVSEAIAMPGAYIVPRGNPAGRENVMKFIASCQNPERQIALLSCHGMTPSNPEAFGMIPNHLKRFAVTSEENLPQVLLNDPVWWAENGGDALNRHLDAIS